MDIKKSSHKRCAMKRAFLHRLRKLGIIGPYINDVDLREWSIYECDR